MKKLITKIANRFGFVAEEQADSILRASSVQLLARLREAATLAESYAEASFENFRKLTLAEKQIEHMKRELEMYRTKAAASRSDGL